MKRLFCAALLALTAACSREAEPPAPAYYAQDNPEALSAWGMVRADNGALALGARVEPYNLATPLFSDYALKLRTVWTPPGEAASYRDNATFDFPVGTVITKTFYYPQEGASWTGAVMQAKEEDANGAYDAQTRSMPLSGVRLLETRVLVRRETGWDALPYVWNEEQTDAVLKRAGALIPLTLVRDDGRREAFPYVAPNANQCAGCHATNATTKEIEPIGPKARHLNTASVFSSGANQLKHWEASGLLSGIPASANAAPRNAIWTDLDASLDARARAYLDINCSHCHNPSGPADTSGMNLEPDAAGPALGKCKAPIAAGGGSGGRPYGIVPGAPEQSITVFRMETTDPGKMMPELGRAVSHEEGVALIAAWIEHMQGECV